MKHWKLWIRRKETLEKAGEEEGKVQFKEYFIQQIKKQIEQVHKPKHSEIDNRSVNIAFCSFAYSNSAIIKQLLMRGLKFEEGNFRGMIKIER